MGLLKTLRRKLRRSLIPASVLRDLDELRLGQGRILAELNRTKPVQPISHHEFRVFSQWGEDGVIQRLVSHIPVAHRTFIEFGVEDFAQANCRFLLFNNNWRGFVIDSSEQHVATILKADWLSRYDLCAACSMVSREGINEILQRSGFDRDLGLLSIDVDGIDYWLFEALTVYSPRILVVEFNALFGPTRLITVPYDPAFRRRAKHYSELYYGASLAAWVHLADRKGYALVGVESAGVNAFFVRRDVLPADVAPLTAAEAFVQTGVRQSRDRDGRLDFLALDAQLAAIRGCEVVNVATGLPERF